MSRDALRLSRRHPAVFRRNALGAALLAAMPLAAGAVDVDYQVGVSYLHSDNISLNEADPISENLLMPQVHFTAREDSSVLQMRMDGSLQYLMYRNDLFDDEFRGNLNAQLDWTLLPERLHWVVEDYLSQQPINTLSGFSPSNQQQVNVFVTGPSFFARLTPATTASMDLRYTNTYAEDTNTYDGDRYNVAARLLRDVSPTQKLSLNAEATRVEYDEGATAFNYKRYDAYVGYSSQTRLLDLDIQAGYSRLDMAQRSSSKNDPLVRADLSWKVASHSQFRVRANYEFADATQTLVIDTVTPGAIGAEPHGPVLQVSPNALRQTRFDGEYNYTSERVRLVLQPYYARIRYIDGVSQDNDIRGTSATLDYEMRPGWHLAGVVAEQRREYTRLDRDDRDYMASAALGREFSRHWTGRFELQRRKRNSSDPGQSYSENAIIISLQYRR